MAVTFTRIPCCVECGASYLPKARYALTTLLRPIRLEPDWVGRNELRSPGVYYGPNPNLVGPGTLRITLHSTTEAYFQDRKPLPLHQAGPDAGGLLRLFPLQEPAAESNDEHLLLWDPLASSFFFLSGWQEWVDRTRDVHGRFPYARSVQAHFDLPYDPMVDRYRRFIRSHLEDLGLVVRRRLWNGRPSAVCVTHDIDYHRKWRPGILYGETVRNVFLGDPHGRIRGMGRLIGALAGSMVHGDPFRRSLDAMLASETVAGFGSTWFFKAGAHGPQDVDYSLESNWAARVIDRLESAGFEVGLHSSYFAADHVEYLDNEQRRLQKALSTALQSVRSHYLRWFSGVTPRNYAEAGFSIDSTLGFAEQEGFRNGTTVPFRLYDIPANQVLDIWEMPLAVMDSTLYGYRNMSQEDGIEATMTLLDATKEFGGVLVILWHNIMLDPLGDARIAPHFRTVLDRLDPREIYVASLRDALSVWLDQTAATTLGNE